MVRCAVGFDVDLMQSAAAAAAVDARCDGDDFYPSHAFFQHHLVCH